MNIALFASAFYPSLGGVEELTRQLAHAHRRAGHQVMIVTERWPRDLPEAEEHEGLAVRRFPMRVPASCLRSKISYRLTTRAIQQKVTRTVRDFGADLLHVQCVSSATLYALGAKRTLGLPLVVTLQGELTMDASGIYQPRHRSEHHASGTRRGGHGYRVQRANACRGRNVLHRARRRAVR